MRLPGVLQGEGALVTITTPHAAAAIKFLKIGEFTLRVLGCVLLISFQTSQWIWTSRGAN